MVYPAPAVKARGGRRGRAGGRGAGDKGRIPFRDVRQAHTL